MSTKYETNHLHKHKTNVELGEILHSPVILQEIFTYMFVNVIDNLFYIRQLAFKNRQLNVYFCNLKISKTLV